MNTKLQKVTWKHPTVTVHRNKFGKLKEKNDEELEEVEIDKERKHYEVDDEEEGEGGFNLQELVKKVEEQEERREAAEEAGQDEDSDDGMHRVKKKPKKKREKVSCEVLHQKILTMIETTMREPTLRATVKKDYTHLQGHFIAVSDLDPCLKRLQTVLDAGEDPSCAHCAPKRMFSVSCNLPSAAFTGCALKHGQDNPHLSGKARPYELKVGTCSSLRWLVREGIIEIPTCIAFR